MDDVNMDDQDPDNNANWVTVVNRIRRYKASVNVNNLTDNSINSKIAIVQSAVGDLEDYFGTKIFFQGKERFITVEFGKKESMLEACKRQLEADNDYKLQPTLNSGDEEVQNHSLIVRDLPLNVNCNLLKQILEKMTGGNITDLKIRVKGPFMVANVIFDNANAVNNVKDVWSIVYLKNLCRIEPANITKEDKDLRYAHVLKLANIPFGITAYNLKDLLTEINAQTCLFPRTRNSYSRQRYALIAFKTEDKMIKATADERQLSIKGCLIYWVEPEKKTCHKCGSPDHLIKQCLEIEQNTMYKNRQAQYSKIYTRYRVPNYRRINNYRYNNNNRNYQRRNFDEDFQTPYNQRNYTNNYENWNQLHRVDNYANRNQANRVNNNNQNEFNNTDVKGMIYILQQGMADLKKGLTELSRRVDSLEKGQNTTNNTQTTVV